MSNQGFKVSNLFDAMGIGNWDIGYILITFAIVIFILLVICIVLCVELCKLKKRYNRFSNGRDAKSLEQEIGNLFNENRMIREVADRNKKDIRVLYRNMESTFQKVGLVKYDAFSQMGGKLSFSLALLNEKNDGFIINSVHGSDGCYTYSKEIKNGVCDLTLGEEEQNALNAAMRIQ